MKAKYLLWSFVIGCVLYVSLFVAAMFMLGWFVVSKFKHKTIVEKEVKDKQREGTIAIITHTYATIVVIKIDQELILFVSDVSY